MIFERLPAQPHQICITPFGVSTRARHAIHSFPLRSQISSLIHSYQQCLLTYAAVNAVRVRTAANVAITNDSPCTVPYSLDFCSYADSVCFIDRFAPKRCAAAD